ncbi:replication initiation protein [Amycolatopsis cynarae]|uniref:Replication initiation protein n=1 Tax=Amycolatopsis cynarae TaxID=2995223 RepID=A0ABY7B6W0_9PSEU|nr:replication initiator [Amycolatopsis sp. HUAS 11-8]WAL66616.1 replication initiation protein [Amycolatopsis sp. HUAS 11-8]
MNASAAHNLADRIHARLTAPGYKRWRARVEATGGCLKPVHLTGSRTLIDPGTGTILDRYHGVIYAPCGNRRESVCPACSDRYASDAFHLIRCGVSGGKTVPATVTDKPRLFLTLTAPSFGAVHTRPVTRTGKPRPCPCGEFHHPDDARLGTAIDPDTYDYRGAVLWQGHASELWHRFTIQLRRELATAAGIRAKDFPQHARVSYAKVAEYQKRGLVHFHAVIRLDGPTGPDDPAPDWADTELLEHATRAAATTATVSKTFLINGREENHTFTWGNQIDLRVIANPGDVEDNHGHITDQALAGYIAKYATKGTSTSETPDRPIRSERDIDHLTVHPHHKRMIATAWDLGGNEDLTHLRRWAHMLGFRGHFLTKSQRYSVTFTQLRGDRRAWQHHAALQALGVEPGSVVVINHWNHTGNGHADDAERELAEAIYQRKRDNRTTNKKEDTP